LSDGDTPSVETVTETVQPIHGVIYEDQPSEAKRDTPLPVCSKKSKYDDNLDFAANHSNERVMESESEDAEYDPLD